MRNKKQFTTKVNTLYNDYQAVEQALQKQMIYAVPVEYLDALRNTDTSMINDTIPIIAQYLQTNYGRVADQKLIYKEDKLKTFVYDLDTPYRFCL